MSNLKLAIGNKNYSSWSLRPWMLLRHLGLEFEEVLLQLDTPQFKAQVAQWSPARRVPVLRDGTLAIWDSLAICEYACELAGRGWPRGVPRTGLLARERNAFGLRGTARQLGHECACPESSHRHDAGAGRGCRAHRRGLVRLPG